MGGERGRREGAFKDKEGEGFEGGETDRGMGVFCGLEEKRKKIALVVDQLLGLMGGKNKMMSDFFFFFFFF